MPLIQSIDILLLRYHDLLRQNGYISFFGKKNIILRRRNSELMLPTLISEILHSAFIVLCPQTLQIYIEFGIIGNPTIINTLFFGYLLFY